MILIRKKVIKENKAMNDKMMTKMSNNSKMRKNHHKRKANLPNLRINIKRKAKRQRDQKLHYYNHKGHQEYLNIHWEQQL